MGYSGRAGRVARGWRRRARPIGPATLLWTRKTGIKSAFHRVGRPRNALPADRASPRPVNKATPIASTCKTGPLASPAVLNWRPLTKSHGSIRNPGPLLGAVLFYLLYPVHLA